MKEEKKLEQAFRDEYAIDPAGCVFRELAGIHARINVLGDIVASASPTATRLYELCERVAALEAELEKGEKKK